jgi:sugar/nucleoside kinase (ribokinase family)
MKEIDVLVIGRACLDHIAVVPRYPAEDEKEAMTSRMIEGGGQGSTASCCIARLGGRVVYVGKVGDDEEGRFCLKRLSDFGVDTSLVETVKGGATPVACITVTEPTGKRTIVYEPYRLPPVVLDEGLRRLVEAAKVVLLDPQVTHLAPGLGAIADKEIRIVYDAERWREGIAAMMQVADYFIPSADFLEAEELKPAGKTFRERIRNLKGRVHGELIVTAGAEGAYFFEGGRLFRAAPPPVEVRDTTGAGDNFHAAFAFALSRDFVQADAVRFSVAVASLSCREYGGRKGLPEYGEAWEASRLSGAGEV